MSDDAQSGWQRVCGSGELTNRPVGRTIRDTAVVLFRDEQGRAAALLDRCPHGLGPLSTGYVAGDVIVCAYHGLRVDRRGECVDARIESASRDAARVDSFPLEERDGGLWIWMGDPTRADPSLIAVHREDR